MSVLEGGKFANGAGSAAFSMMLSSAYGAMAQKGSRNDPMGGSNAEVDENTPLASDNAEEGGRGVYAIKGGKFFRASWQNSNDHNAGLGFRLSISDADGYTQYGHMSPDALSVNVGDVVSEGQYLGEYASPKNGNSSGPHVHIEMRSNSGALVNPGSISPLRGGRITAPYQAIDSMHKKPHQGIDYAY